MTYNIPDALAPYLEYIPEDMLSNIITEALRDRIFQKPVTQEAPAQQIDITQLMEQLQSMIGSSAASDVKTALKASKPVTETEVAAVVIDVGEDEIPDDLQGLVKDFASGLFK